MKKTVALIDKLLALAKGMVLPASKLKGDWFECMREEGVVVTVAHGSHKSLRAIDGQSFRRFIAEKYGIADLESCRKMLLAEEADRAMQVEITGNSKFTGQRTCEGFLVNSYQPVSATLHGQPFTVLPPEGSYVFIADYDSFSIPDDVVVIGVENVENFRYVQRQRELFESCVSPEATFLFVCRYPQNGDLPRWLVSIPNKYVHFGDLDLAGIHIYLSEYYSVLGSKASFLIPPDYDTRIEQGAADRYDTQYQKFKNMVIPDSRVQNLVDSIHRHHKGYDQEGYIS